MIFNLPAFLALLSGCSALIYEILWFRLLANIWGTTMVAASVVAGLFLGGVAIGSLVLGRRIETGTKPWLWLTVLEGGIGLSGILMPVCLHALEQSVGMSSVSGNFGMLLSVLAMLVPTILMGGTLPALCRMLEQKDTDRPLAVLYAMNTLGAAVGVMLAGFVLLPVFGERTAAGVAILGNMTVAAFAFSCVRTKGLAGTRRIFAEPLKIGTEGLRVYVLAAGVGAVALAAEMLWMRLFPLFVGNTTYAFSLVLTVYLIGIGSGSALYARWIKKESSRRNPVAALLLVMVVGLGVSLLGFDLFGNLFYQGELIAGTSWVSLMASRVIISLPILLPMTVASGAIFPALQRHGRNGGEEIRVSYLLAANIAGSILGSLMVPVMLLPVFGLQGSFRFLMITLLILTLIAAGSLKGQSKLFWGRIALIVLLALVPRTWDAHVMNAGIYIYAADLEQEGGLQRDKDYRSLLHHADGIEASVAIFENRASGGRSFTVNGKVDGGTGDLGTQILLGQLPALIHPDPREVLVIGLGTGITAAQVAGFPDANVEVIEISPEVIEVLNYFTPEHHGVGNKPNVRIRQGDARRELLHTDGKYDLIISEPSNPWQVGNNRLFTREFYLIAKSRLEPGGLFCQWLPVYDLSPDRLKGAVATFLETFPGAHAFISQGSDIILVAGADPEMTIDVPLLAKKMEGDFVRSAMAVTKVSTVKSLFREVYLGGADLVKQYASGSAVNTDGQNRLEYFRFTSKQFLIENRDAIVDAARQVGALRYRTLSFPGQAGEELRREVFSQ